MADLFDYLEWRGDLTFEQSPFCKIDGIILAQLVYINYTGLVSPDFKTQIELPQLWESLKSARDYTARCDMGPMVSAHTPELLERACRSARFAGVKACAYSELFDRQKNEQFAAITFVLPDKTCIIAFRGTDDTLVGWRENFNLGYLPKIPSQVQALDYVSEAYKALKTKLILAGHSKGGNLALHTAVYADSKIRKKINKIYDFDGPGFSSDFYQKPEFLEIKDRLCVIYPEQTIVGMIFHRPRHFEVIKSESFAVYQHDPFNWHVLGADFEKANDICRESKFFHKSLNHWIETMSIEEKENFISSLFDVIQSSEYERFSAITKNVVPASARMIKKLGKMDKEMRNAIFNSIHELSNVVRAEIPILRLLNKGN